MTDTTTNTTTTPREALLQVAHLFETKPACYQFLCTHVPAPKPGEPHWHQRGCVLGWVAYFADLKTDNAFSHALGQYPHALEVAADFLGYSHDPVLGNNVSRFYLHMDALEGDDTWVNQADVCARILHEYADKYFPTNEGASV